MKKALLLGIILLCPHTCVRHAYEQSFVYQLFNDSDYAITFLIPCYDLLWDSGPVLSSIDIKDTTLAYYGPKMSGGPCEKRVPSRSFIEDFSGFSSVDQIVLNDTVRVFIYETKLFQGEDINEYFEGLKQLQRYDLGLEDLRNLTNSQGKLEIHWPPDIRMSEMNMVPIYGHYKKAP